MRKINWLRLGLLSFTAVMSMGMNKSCYQPVVTTNVYHTADQMLLANELNESGEPFAEALGYNLDLLDPFVPGSPDNTAYVLGIENYEYSRYQLGTVISRSGIGLHMMWAPLVKQAAANEPAGFDGSLTGTPNGYNEDDEIRKIIMNFGTLSNQPPPGHPWPQFAEFRAGDPHLPQAVDANTFAWLDFSTLRWDRSKMDKTLEPAALGQSLMKQYLWAQDMLSAFHDGQDVGIDATGSNSPDLPNSPFFDPNNDIYYGGDSVDGFVGMTLTAEAINKVAFLKGALAYDGTTLGGIDLATYNPQNGIKFFPHGIAVSETPVATGLPPQASALSVSDASSRLFDQVSLLWGTSSFTNMMDPSDSSDPAHLAYHEVFDGSPFPAAKSQTGVAGPYDLMKGTSRALFLNLKAMHYDAANHVFVDKAYLAAGGVTQDPEVSIVPSTYLIVALEPFIGEFAGTPLQAAAQAAVSDQAQFIIDNLAMGGGAYGAETTVGSTSAPTETDLAAQASAVRALYVAHRVTGNAAFLTAANDAYNYLIANYYSTTGKIFRTNIGDYYATYTPRNFALVAGALREASLEGGQLMTAATIYTDFFQTVGNVMQLGEEAPTGESGGDSDGDGIPYIPEQPDQLPPVFAEQAEFHVAP